MKASMKWLAVAAAIPAMGLAGCTTQKDCPSGVCASTMKKAHDCAPCASDGTAKNKARPPDAPAYAEINTAALATLLKSGTPVVLLDARVGQWDDGRRLPGAKALAPDATETQALTAIGEKNALVVTYCTNLQCPASKHLTLRLIKLGFTNVLKYPEGIDDWQAAGHEVLNVK